MRVTPLDLARRSRVTASDTDGLPGRGEAAHATSLAQLASSPTREWTDAELTSMVESGFPEMIQLLRWLGCDSLESWVGEWSLLRGADWVASVLAPSNSVRTIDAWREVLDARSDEILLLETLVFETNLGRYAHEAARAMPRRFRYDKTLHVVRQRAALALWEHALTTNWRRPFVFCRALRLARIYLAGVVADREFTDKPVRFQFTGRLGQASVLLARFEQVSVADLVQSTDVIRRSIEEGNPACDAVPYLLEAYLRLHDQTGDREYLGLALQADRSFSGHTPGVSWQLHVAEAWLRLADGQPNDANLPTYLDRAEKALSAARSDAAAEESVRCTVLERVASAARSVPDLLPTVQLGLKRLQNPFGLGEHLLRFAESGYPADSLPAILVDSLRREFGSAGDPLPRRLLSDCLRVYTQISGDTAMRQGEYLREALRLQEGWTGVGPLTDELSRIRYADDLLETAALQGSSELWSLGMARLIREVETNPTSCVPLVRLGREADKGLPYDGSAELQVRGQLKDLAQADIWIRAAMAGDSKLFYKEAAARAISSPDLVRRNLGGRSNVVTVEDYLGFTTATLVFKPTNSLCFERDTQKSLAVANMLRRLGVESEFGIIDLITTIVTDDLAHAEEEFPDGTEILTVRRFEHGAVLAERLSPATPDASSALLRRAAVFLAYIHASEERPGKPATSVRKDVSNEVRRWLKNVLPPQWSEDSAAVFKSWWPLIEELGLPPQPRRDAHAFNWLVTDDERIIAIDLEATRWRPMGYELAQLTDDVPAFPVDRWDLRRAVVEEYAAALGRSSPTSSAPDVDQLWTAYRVSLLARALRGLSSRDNEPDAREHSEALLDEMSAHIELGPLRELATRLRDAWAVRRGSLGSTPLRKRQDGRRQRISRTLAYQLRHGQLVRPESDGWVAVENVVSALAETSQRADAEELLAVAQAWDEDRFEVDGRRIRARYGHSRPAAIEYESGQPGGPLYHSTPTSALHGIFEKEEGLLPMTRQWVHLTTDRDTALRTGLRHGPSVLLSVPDPATQGLECLHSGGTIWLLKAVPPTALTVVPLYRLFSSH
ncbi:RNA 2'-phosphotransferase [Streptomyces sp. CA-278952]|uniref:RNA 2'-phosphotransferase n=1 Tax=unclassified Streptomyces TaxID=2593676 RepID=UPI002368AD4C|nr:RNA 2'-phosphotransferase [Streptomyces sp. CA-278952]WDG33733.1 RNA 2'-phosphotransferase [Streptomyces sp. CA-278952]